MKRIALHTVEFRALGPLIGILALVVTIATFLGVFQNEIYQDSEWANAQWLGQDIITLIISVPLLLLAGIRVIINKSLTWELTLAGVLLYLVYIYTFYVFEANFTFLYFFHLTIFSISLLCLFLVVHHLLNARNDYIYSQRITKASIIVFLLVISFLLASLWMQDLIKHLTIERFFSRTPDGEPPLVIYTLDLGIVLPLMVTAALLFMRNHALGLLLTGIVLIKTFLIGFAFSAMSVSMYWQDLDRDTFPIIMWSLMGLAGLFHSMVFFRNLEVFPRMGKRE